MSAKGSDHVDKSAEGVAVTGTQSEISAMRAKSAIKSKTDMCAYKSSLSNQQSAAYLV